MIKGVLIVILIVLISFVGYLGYIIFINFYSSPEFFRASYQENRVLVNSSVEQFYSNMRFKSNQITYYIGDECTAEKVGRMIGAFKFLENVTSLRFYGNSLGSAEIEIRCGMEYKKGNLFVAGEGGPKEIINGSLFNVITSGEILLLYQDSRCLPDNYNVELHELLHVLGFEHSPDERNIMYNLSSCNQVTSQETINQINELYHIESLPDLYFKDISAVKKGSYLNLNFTVINQGLESARDVSIDIEEANKSKQLYNFTEIGIGEGRLVWIENFRISLDTKNIILLINNGKELDLGNNKAELGLS